MEDIKKSELYQKMVNEKDLGKLAKLMGDHFKSQDDKSFGLFSEKKVAVDDPEKLKVKIGEKKVEDAKKNLRQKFDNIFHAQILDKECDNVMDDLGKFSMVHKDSKELKNLKAKTRALQDLMQTNALHKELSPEAKKALKEAYEASVAYERAKREDAKVPDSDKTWEPSSTGGKARMRGAKKIQELAMRFIGDEIAKERSLEANRALNAYQTTAQNEKAFSDKSIFGRMMQQSQNKLNEMVTEQQNIKQDATAEVVSANLANIIATRKVGEAAKDMTYGDLLGPKPLPSGQATVHEAEEALNGMIQTATQQIMQRPDFQKMVQGMSLEEAKQLALSPDGGKLVAKLAQAKKQLLAEEKQQQAPGKQAGKQMDKKNFSM